MKFHINRATIKKYFPFALIFLTVIVLIERRESGPLPPPDITLLAQEQRTSAGKDFTLPTLHKESIRLADLTGNVVLLNFFETWCPPCREEMPSLEALYQAYKSQDFVLLAVAGDSQGQEVVEPFVEKFGLTFPVALDSQSQVSEHYDVRGIPTVYLLDKQGKIAAKFVGGADWNSEQVRALIAQLLQEV